MTLSYFDSSVILTILLEENKKYEAYEYWQNAKIKVSSILLKIETIVTLRRAYENNKIMHELAEHYKFKTNLL